MKKFAFILMGEDYDPNVHRAEFQTPRGVTGIYTVRNFEEAERQVLACAADGTGVIELCGAFGEERARKFIAMTKEKVGIGFVIHLLEQNSLFDNFFGN